MQPVPANVELQIEELVLHGLPYDQRHRVAAAVERELARLLQEQGVPAGWEGLLSLSPGPVAVNPRLSAETIGQQVALAVYGYQGNHPPAAGAAAGGTP
jgi:hypothetical protein